MLEQEYVPVAEDKEVDTIMEPLSGSPLEVHQNETFMSNENLELEKDTV